MSGPRNRLLFCFLSISLSDKLRVMASFSKFSLSAKSDLNLSKSVRLKYLIVVKTRFCSEVGVQLQNGQT